MKSNPTFSWINQIHFYCFDNFTYLWCTKFRYFCYSVTLSYLSLVKQTHDILTKLVHNYWTYNLYPNELSNSSPYGCDCGSNVFQVYFDDAKDSSQESRVKQVSRIKESFNQSKFQESKSRSIKASFKNQDESEDSREDSIKISIKRVFQNIEYHNFVQENFSNKNILPRVLLSGSRLP